MLYSEKVRQKKLSLQKKEGYEEQNNAFLLFDCVLFFSI